MIRTTGAASAIIQGVGTAGNVPVFTATGRALTDSGVPPFSTMASGTEASPGLHFTAAATTGFFHSTNADYGAALSIAVQGVEQVEFIRRGITPGRENAWMLLGSGDPVTDETTDTYIATIGVQSFNWSGIASHPVAINIGTVSATITDTTTKTGLACMGELDKLDIFQSGGPVTVNTAAGWRIRSPIPYSGVTITKSKCLIFTDPSLAIEGTVTNHEYIQIPSTAGSVNGPTTTVGIKYEDMPNGGSVTTDGGVTYWLNSAGPVIINGGPSHNIDITAGTGSNAGVATLKGAGAVLDTRTTSTRVLLKNNGSTVIEVANTTGANYITFDASSTPMLRANHASNANVTLNISSKGTSAVQIMTGGGSYKQLEVMDRTSAVNSVFIRGGTTGNVVTVGAQGSDTDVTLSLAPQGDGLIRVGNSASFAANGAVATTMTGVGPTGAHTTVQEWLAIQNSSGTVRYIPLY